MLKNKPFWISLALLSAYLLLGYFAGPLILQPRLEQYVSSQLGRELRFEQLRVDPITWSATLQKVDLPASEQGLWPGLSISADRIDLRFSFWKLTPSVAALTLQDPRFILNAENERMQSGRYPFVSLWRQWQESSLAGAGFEPIAIRQWRVEGGQALIAKADLPVANVLLDKIFLQADKQDPDGLRKYNLTFSVNKLADIKAQGLFRSADLSSKGQYQLVVVNSPQESMGGFEAEGAFDSEFLADEMQVTLTESQLRAEQFSACLLEGLMCAAISPLQTDFEAVLLATTDAIRLLQANAQMKAFALDASMGKGSLVLARQRAVDSARIELSLPQVLPSDASDMGDSRNFVIQLFAADSDQYRLDGQFDMQSQQTAANLQISGKQEISGTVGLQRVGPQALQAAFSQLDLRLNNPQASLAQDFMKEYLGSAFAAKTLQLKLTASMDDMGLRLEENISLEQLRLLPNPDSELARDSELGAEPQADPGLDAEWLLALLQDPQDSVSLEIPELQMNFATPSSLREVLQQQIFSMLSAFAEQPFVGLAEQFQLDDQELDEVYFAAGKAALNAASAKTIAELANVLLQRPRLGIAMAGVYDSLIDNKALQTEQVRTHIALASAAELAFRTGSEPTDFNDPVVHSVIDEFARRRLPAKVLQAFADYFGQADVDQGVLPEGDAADYYAKLFELVVDHAEIPQSALSTLARYRAQAVMEALEAQGVAPERLQAADQPTISEARVSGVPLPLQVQIWREGNAAPTIDAAPKAVPSIDPNPRFED